MSTLIMEDIEITPAAGYVGAWVHGVDLVGSGNARTKERLRRALHEYGVLFFDFDDIVSPEDFKAFGDLFGEVEDGYRLATEIAKKKSDGVMDSNVTPMKDFQSNCWHSDGTLFECPPQAAMLTAVEVPAVGGNTMWASMYAAWEDLSSHYQRLLEGVEVLHSSRRLPWMNSEATAVHPAVIRDAVTGKKMLFVNANYTDRILGMSDRESETTLQMLFDHVNTPEFHVSLAWQPGRIAVWEQRVTQHRGVNDFKGTRRMRRLTLIGDRPTA